MHGPAVSQGSSFTKRGAPSNLKLCGVAERLPGSQARVWTGRHQLSLGGTGVSGRWHRHVHTDRVPSWDSQLWGSSWGITAFSLVLPSAFWLLRNLESSADWRIYVSILFVLFSSQKFKHSGSWMIRQKLEVFPISLQDAKMCLDSRDLSWAWACCASVC